MYQAVYGLPENFLLPAASLRDRFSDTLRAMQSLLEGLLHASPLVVACIVFALVFAEDALFLGRFTAFFRAVMPALAGLSQMPYRRFAAWNFTGGII